jgi:hypothetical protein
MLTILLILAANEPVVGGVAGGSATLAFVTWLAKRHLKKRDAKAREMKALLNGILDNTHKTQTDCAVMRTRLDAGDQRMERLEAGQDDIRQDIRVLKRRSTGKPG